MKRNMFFGAMVLTIFLAGCGSNDFPDSASELTKNPNAGHDNMPQRNENPQPAEEPTIQPTPEPKNPPSSTSQFRLKSENGESSRLDSVSKLEWTASPGSGNDSIRYQAAITTESADKASAISHCDTLNFAGKEDWRVPSDVESTRYMKAMKSENITPYYNNECPMTIGINSYNQKVIGIFTKYSQKTVGFTQTWEDLLMEMQNENKVFSYCIKCVRKQ